MAKQPESDPLGASRPDAREASEFAGEVVKWSRVVERQVSGCRGNHPRCARYGRRAALTFSVAAMAIPTFLVGALPGYQVLGMAAPILLTLLRMIQGLSVGGEYTTSIVFMVERAPPGRRGFIGAMAGCGAVGGILLGSATGTLLASTMSAEALETWGWRIPFLLGLLVGFAGFILRRHVQETPKTRKAVRSPLLETMRNHSPLLARLAALSVFNSVGFYLLFVYIVSWLELVDGMAPARALGINTISKPVMRGALVLGFVGALPFFWLMHHDDSALVLLGQMGFVIAVGTFVGTQPTIMVEAAPVAVRCTAIALGYNVTLGVVGGLTPLAATWIIERTGNDYSPAFMIMAAAVISFVALVSFKETYKMPLEVA